MAEAAETNAEKNKHLADRSASDVDDASTSISTGMNDTLDDLDSFAYTPMPLLRYSRVGGTVGPSVSSASNVGWDSSSCTCSALAQIILDPSAISTNPEGTISPSSDHLNHEDDLQSLLRSDLWKQPHCIMALGFEDGHISVVSVHNGTTLGDEEKFNIRTILTAIDSEGAAATWEIRYTVTLQQQEQQRENQESSTATVTSNSSSRIPDSNTSGSMFSSLMSALTGMPPSGDENISSQSRLGSTRQESLLAPMLAATVVHVSRIAYPKSWSTPVCLAADPANRKKREKSFITGFQDGRLVLTRRGGLFQRRNDTVVYHGTPDSSSQAENYRGIECIAWRGSFVAWADASGIKLLDIETLTRIAHVDRPSGARSTRYPSLSSLRPTLLFETSHSLLVGWGDCLMGIEIKETLAQNTETKRRSVECTMAWELDCVACGVVPLDIDHVVVLGLVPIEDGQDEDLGKEYSNDLEVQIVSRGDGAVMYCDSLPILRSDVRNPTPGLLAESASSYRILSSFALPRMDDNFELEQLKYVNNETREDFDTTSFFPSAVDESPKFCDSHLQWSVKSIFFDEERPDSFDVGDCDTASVDSDDYGFLLRSVNETDGREIDGIVTTVPPPVMVIICPSDFILSQTSTVDDAVAHALSRNRHALALSRGLRHKRQLRRYEITNLVDCYLSAVLRLNPPSDQSLSLRRMELAVKSMPYLLGDQTDQWGTWAKKLECIPGALFLLCKYLPVRGKCQCIQMNCLKLPVQLTNGFLCW
eukprot:scaffold1888_cov120-Cylindrotheca_fusiformis.AAC.12